MEDWSEIPRSTCKLSWRRTLLTQAALCLALYGAFSIGRPQGEKNPAARNKRELRREPLDLYFLSVGGGFWPAEEQKRLLEQMRKAAEFYKATFVINIGELGEDDPLLQNATMHFSILKIPWYATTASSGGIKKYFFKKFKISNEQILDIVGLNTGLWQDFPCFEELNESGIDQLRWMQQTLSMTESKWRIIVGFHPLMIYQEENVPKLIAFYEPIHQMFLKYRVNAYLSLQNCAGQYHDVGGIAYLGIPGPLQKGQIPASQNEKPNCLGEKRGFFLHRVTSLEIESYFIDLAGKVISSSKIHQHGRGVM